MDLNGERLRGAQHFKQERQFAKAGGNLVAEQGGFIASITSRSERGWPSAVRICELLFGCAPIHSSAIGRLSGLAMPYSSVKAVWLPQA
jgi:hypothetical protein